MKTLTAADRTSLIRLASTLPKGSEMRKAILTGLQTASFDPLEEIYREPSPEEFQLRKRSRTLDLLTRSLKRASSVLGNPREVGKTFKKPDGSPWISGALISVTPPEDVSYVIPSRLDITQPSDPDFESSDPASVFFTQEYKPDRNGIVSRWYNEVGYTTRGGRRIVLAKGPWDQGRNAFAALQKALEKGPLAEIQRDTDDVWAKIEKLAGG